MTAAALEIPPVPFNPMSIWQIERDAYRWLGEYAPEMLCRPHPLDIVDLVDHVLPTIGVGVVPLPPEEMSDLEAYTDFTALPHVDVVLRDDQWDALFDRCDLTWRARSTVAHELGHVVLHIDAMQQLVDMGVKSVQMKCASRCEVPAYRDPEWQAYCFAAFVLMPRRVLLELETLTPEYVSEVYDVSPEMARYYLRLLTRNGLL